MQKVKLTQDEKKFLGTTPFRRIGITEVAYDDLELTEKLKKELEERGFEVSKKGVYTTEFCKKRPN